MDVIRWDCGETTEKTNEVKNNIEELKNKLFQYKQLFENKHISEGMFAEGFNEIYEDLNIEVEKSVKNLSTLNANELAVGTIGCLCPNCNESLNFIFGKQLENVHKLGTVMILKKGKYGKFWGCSNYPECKCTKNVSNKIVSNKYFNDTIMYDYDDDYDDYVPDHF